MWAKLSDSSHAFYKSEVCSGQDLVQRIRSKIAIYFKISEQSDADSFIGLIDLLPVVKLQKNPDTTSDFITKALAYSVSQIEHQKDPSLRKT